MSEAVVGSKDHPTSGSVTDTDQNQNRKTVIKCEKRRRDEVPGEYDEWAKRLVNRPIPQLQPTIGGGGGTNLTGQIFQSGNGTFLIQGLGSNTATSCVGGDGLPPHNGYDMDSAIGRFLWLTLGDEKDKYVPCIYRDGTLFCCVRMAETVLDTFFKTLPPDIPTWVVLNSHNLTQTEAKLLTYVNSWHCDGFYGNEPFTTHDLLVKTEDLEKYYAFLSFSYQVLHSGGGNKAEDYSRCGFVHVNQDALIPYAVLDGEEKGVPLFYFEGQIDILNAKSQFLTPSWELAYLKLCCKVQGVRKDLITNDNLRVVRLVDLKGYFPKRTTFIENNWPQPKPKSLLPRQQTSYRWATRILPNDTFDKTLSNSSSLTTKTFGGFSLANSQYNTTTNGTVTQLPTLTQSALPVPPALNAVSMRNGYVMSHMHPNSAMTSVIVGPSGGQIQVPKNQIVASRTMNFAKIKAPGPPADTTKLTIIPEFAPANGNLRDQQAYGVRMIIIDREVMHCINQKPHKSDVYLLVLQEFLMKFFPAPQVAIYPTCVTVLRNHGITTFLPNSAQVRAFNTFGFSISKVWELPLITATDAASQLNKLKALLTPKPITSVRPTPMNPMVQVYPNNRLPPNSTSVNTMRSYATNSTPTIVPHHGRNTRSNSNATATAAAVQW